MLRTMIARTAICAALIASAAHADEILHFTTAASTSGIRGQGITYKGYIHPRSRKNFVTSAVFSDVDLPSSVIMISNSGDSTIDPVTREEIPASDTHEVLVGRSIDGGTNFSFRRALRWTNGIRMVRVVMVPDPGRDRVWAGLAQVYRNVPNSPSEEFQGTTRIEIDWARKMVRLTKATGTGWDDYPFGTTNPPEPGYLSAAIRYIRFSHLASVTVISGQRFEAWASEPTEPQGAPQTCSGTDPEYVQNTSAWASQTGGLRRGVRILWYRFDPVSGIDAGSRKVIGSNVRALPSDNPRSDLLVTRAELGAEEFLYVGTQDQILCEELIGQNTSGASVRFIRLQYDASADNYTETEHAFLFNIGIPSAPNWTCPSGVSCSAGTRNAYAFVGAIPFQSGTTMQVYANAWGGGRPSLPVVGEVGTVQLSSQGPSTAPRVVSLQQVYREPVVFIQPASAFDPSSAVARVTAVGTSSFSVVLQEESTADCQRSSKFPPSRSSKNPPPLCC